MPTEPSARHRKVAAGFTAAAASVTDWEAPAPVDGWTARDVVRHLVEWLPALLSGGAGVTLPPGPSVDDDPYAAWVARVEAVQGLLDDPASAPKVLSNPHIGDVPLPEAIDRFYTTDVFLHTWDLGRAAGTDPGQDPDHCVDLLAGMQPIEEMLRSSGQYGPAAPVGDDATPAERLAAFIGRDPAWGRP